MATVKIILKEDKANASGEAPLYIRLIKDRKPKYISLGFRINPKHWNAEERKVKKSHPNSQRLNNFIASKIAEAEGVALTMETQEKGISTRKIKEAVLGKASESFLRYADAYIKALEKNGQVATGIKAKSIISKLKDYLENKDLLFDQLTVSFLKAYERHLKDTIKNSTNTIHLNLRVIRRIINEAIREDLLPYEKNPFLKFKLKLEKTAKIYLTEELLKQLEDLPLKPGTRKFHHRNMYVFAAYTGGLRISDILTLQWKHFDGERIIIDTQKTGSTVSVKLPSKAKAILELYQKEGKGKQNPEDFVFPILKAGKDYNDPKVLYQAISSATAYTNKDIRAIGKEIGVIGNLSFHSSRHTWATRALRKGMRIEYVSKLMGHTSIKTTQIYAKIVSSELDKAMEIFD
ncbi:site-specific integrase [Adhaeribacter soli]|uniref:Site-specific integrase n=1 Tax=Adhaeribacter soli TaxID=2607655 RepID=A0A5N1IMR2_9BACT|nr:site-specific integrase [Adhaeribacter soli]KAA9331137.1 site-specific integrase [Adhaeribacter soli]